MNRSPANKELLTKEVQHRSRQIGPRWAVTGLFVYSSVFFLSIAKDFLVPIVLAFLLTLVFSPIRRFFGKFGIPSALASIVIVGLLLAGLVAVGGAVVVPISGYVESFPQIEHDLQTKLGGLSQVLSEALNASRRLADLVRSHAVDVQQVELRGNGPLTSAALVVPAMLAQTLLTLILLLFLLASGDLFYEVLIEIMPTVQDKRRAMRIASEIERNLSRYLLTIAAINGSLAFVITITLWLYGMPNPVLFGSSPSYAISYPIWGPSSACWPRRLLH